MKPTTAENSKARKRPDAYPKSREKNAMETARKDGTIIKPTTAEEIGLPKEVYCPNCESPNTCICEVIPLSKHNEEIEKLKKDFEWKIKSDWEDIALLQEQVSKQNTEIAELRLQFGELDNVNGQTVKGANHTSPNIPKAHLLQKRDKIMKELEPHFKEYHTIREIPMGELIDCEKLKAQLSLINELIEGK